MGPVGTVADGSWRLASGWRMRALALVVGAVGVVVVCGDERTERTDRRDRGAGVEGCRFEQRWFQGDHHFWQELVFDEDGNGTWTAGGMGTYAPHEHVEFRWTRDATTLTAVSGGESRTAGYELTPYEYGCWLVFDGGFLGVEGQSRHYADSP